MIISGTIQIYQLDEQNERRYGVKIDGSVFLKISQNKHYDYGTINEQQKVSVDIFI